MGTTKGKNGRGGGRDRKTNLYAFLCMSLIPNTSQMRRTPSKGVPDL